MTAFLLSPLLAAAALAQGFDARTLEAVPDAPDFLVIDDARVTGQGAGGLLLFDLARNPLYYEEDGETVPLVQGQDSWQLLGYYDFRRFWLAALLPVELVQGSDASWATGLGDARLSAGVQLYQAELGRGSAQAGARLGFGLPTGDPELFTGAGLPSLSLGLSGGAELADFRLGAELGWASGTGIEVYDGEDRGRLRGAAGVSAPLLDPFRVAAELDASRWLGFEGGGALAAQGLFSLRAAPLPGLQALLGLGLPLSRGIGVPDLRLLAGLAWVPGAKQELARGEDRDGDGIPDALDACPGRPEDGIGPAPDDGCPAAGLVRAVFVLEGPDGPLARARLFAEAGPVTGEWTVKGGRLERELPAGTYSFRVEAPGLLPERRTATLDPQHGELHFSLADSSSTARVALTLVDEDGRPVPGAVLRVLGYPDIRVQADEDGIIEARIPPGRATLVVVAPGYGAYHKEVEVHEGTNVLPAISLKRESHVRQDAWNIVLTEKIYFESNSAEVLPTSYPVLDEVADLLLRHPEIELVEVQGHTDDKGSDAYNLSLSTRRARAVVLYLVESGVDPQRLRAVGYGKSKPLVDGNSEAARARNRRVEFRILRRAEQESSR